MKTRRTATWFQLKSKRSSFGLESFPIMPFTNHKMCRVGPFAKSRGVGFNPLKIENGGLLEDIPDSGPMIVKAELDPFGAHIRIVNAKYQWVFMRTMGIGFVCLEYYFWGKK